MICYAVQLILCAVHIPIIIRQELFEEIETVIKIVLSGSCVFRATVLSKSAVTFVLVLVLTVSLVSCSTSSVTKLLCKMMKERTILIESCVDDQELA
jgi:hypothetical protein